MNRRERNLLIVLVIVFVASLPFMPFWGAGQPNTARERVGDDSGQGDRTPARAGIADAGAFPRLDKELLAQEPEKFEGAIRNLFTFSEARGTQAVVNNTDEDNYDSDEGGDAASSAEASETALGTGPASQQLTDYEYLGFIERDGTRHAAFFWRGRYFVGVVGETINETFEIKSIEQDYVLIYVIVGDFEQKLTLNPPAGDTDEGDTDQGENS